MFDKINFKITNQEIEEIMQSMCKESVNGDLKFSFTNFLAATIDLKKVLSKEKLWSLFQYFDTGNHGYITMDDLKEIH